MGGTPVFEGHDDVACRVIVTLAPLGRLQSGRKSKRLINGLAIILPVDKFARHTSGVGLKIAAHLAGKPLSIAE